jgi:hypothetical protein
MQHRRRNYNDFIQKHYKHENRITVAQKGQQFLNFNITDDCLAGQNRKCIDQSKNKKNNKIISNLNTVA